jgi:hypothetical protein
LRCRRGHVALLRSSVLGSVQGVARLIGFTARPTFGGPSANDVCVCDWMRCGCNLTGVDTTRHDTTRAQTYSRLVMSPVRTRQQWRWVQEMRGSGRGPKLARTADCHKRAKVECAVCSVQCAVCSVQCAACSIQCLGGEWVRVRMRMRTPVCGRVLQLDGSVG